MVSNVIEFKVKEEVHVLTFTCPKVIRMNKMPNDNITLEIMNGVGKAWVAASSRLEAKKKLHKIISILEWTDEDHTIH